MPASTRVFTKREERDIQRSFEWAAAQEAPFGSDLENALLGVYGAEEVRGKSVEELQELVDGVLRSITGGRGGRAALLRKFLRKAAKNREVFVRADSLSAWAKTATENYGLEARDIQRLKHGDELELLIFDRNMGEYYQPAVGTTYDPCEKGVLKARYIHSDQYRGALIFDSGVVLPCWTWEVNSVRREAHTYWAPLVTDTTGKPKKRVPAQLKVGWRGAAVLLSTARRHMPKRVRRYGTWWDDLGALKTTDLLKVKRRGLK